MERADDPIVETPFFCMCQVEDFEDPLLDSFASSTTASWWQCETDKPRTDKPELSPELSLRCGISVAPAEGPLQHE